MIKIDVDSPNNFYAKNRKEAIDVILGVDDPIRWEQEPIFLEELLNKLNRRFDCSLDFGCALGRNTKILSKFSDKIIGFDQSSSLIELAKQEYPELSSCFTNTLNDDIKYDLIFSMYVLQHNNNVEEWFKYLKNLLKDDGIFILIESSSIIPKISEHINILYNFTSKYQVKYDFLLGHIVLITTKRT